MGGSLRALLVDGLHVRKWKLDGGDSGVLESWLVGLRRGSSSTSRLLARCIASICLFRSCDGAVLVTLSLCVRAGYRYSDK